MTIEERLGSSSDSTNESTEDQKQDAKLRPTRIERFRNREKKETSRSKSLDRTSFLRRRNCPTASTEKQGLVNTLEETSDSELIEAKPIRNSISQWFDDVTEIFCDVGTSQPNNEDETDSLKIKTLKNNILRFNNIVIDPFCTVFDWLNWLQSWKNPVVTFVFLLVVLYVLVHGWLIQILLVTTSITFLITYCIHKRKLCQKSYSQTYEEKDRDKSQKVTDKVTVIINIARKVQNALGSICDTLEKIKNLLLWNHSSTKQVFLTSLGILVLSSMISSIFILKSLAVCVSLKVFLVDYLFTRFPKLRARFDTSNQFWNSLPTDADLSKERKEGPQNNNEMSSRTFWQIFKLPPCEKPLEYWTNGVRCSLLRRDRSVTSAFKTGRMFVTNQY
ncbi:GRAM domain-containing protein 4-like isoform X2 [Artemia franciscana]|uniref:GRAM domain-containing protein 4-like isoform X2 n=1 Tax=Artemia franciscana TaxID=6661 RepID=UPI0032D9B158